MIFNDTKSKYEDYKRCVVINSIDNISDYLNDTGTEFAEYDDQLLKMLSNLKEEIQEDLRR